MKLNKLFVWTLLIVIVTGCSAKTQEMQPSFVGPAGGETVKVWVAGEKQAIDVFDAFTDASGIQVNAEFGSQEEWLHELSVNKGKPRADLFLSDNAIDLALLAEMGVFAPHHSPFNQVLPDDAQDLDGLWYGLTVRHPAIVLSEADSAGGVPASVEQLSDAKWQGQLTVPADESRMWHRILADVAAFEGEPGLIQLLQQWNEQSFTFSDDADGDLRRVADEELPALLTTSDRALRFISEADDSEAGVSVTWLRSKHAEPIDIVSGIGMLRGTENPEAAGKLIDFLLEEGNRRELASERMHEPLTALENGRPNRLHPREMAEFIPLIEHHWQRIFSE